VDKEKIEEKLRAVVCQQLHVTEPEVTLDARFVEDLHADSLDTVELIMAIEEEFDIEIPDEIAEKIKTFGDALGYLQKELL